MTEFSADLASAVRPMNIERLVISGLRNLKRVEIEPVAGLNVFLGNNGQGKTSVLEAIYLVATTRSFRTSRLRDIVMHDEKAGYSRAEFVEKWADGSTRRKQNIGIEKGKRVVLLNGDKPSSLSDYARQSPVVVFEPQQLSISTGPASERRTLLDRVTLFTHPEINAHRARYNRALRERQQLLGKRSIRLDNSKELDAYEQLLARHGALITTARQQATEKLTEHLIRAFNQIAAPDLTLGIRYHAAGSRDFEEGVRQLHFRRRADARSNRAAFGPHRDDLMITINDREARVVGSQGQHRTITLALKSAELACIGQARGVMPILLLDDVSSELDAERTAALFKLLAGMNSQIFLTTTRGDLIVAAAVPWAERRDFVVQEGRVNGRF